MSKEESLDGLALGLALGGQARRLLIDDVVRRGRAQKATLGGAGGGSSPAQEGEGRREKGKGKGKEGRKGGRGAVGVTRWKGPFLPYE
jgi:hypothetical protein